MRRIAAICATLALVGCAASPTPTLLGPGNMPAFVAEVASFQLLAETPNRFTVGLFGADGKWVSFGGAVLSFEYLDDPVVTVPDVDASFLPLPGTPPGDGQAPKLTVASDGRGVYAAKDVSFPA